MSHRRGSSGHVPPKSFTATLSLPGQQVEFQLHTRPLQLGPNLEIQYYWMNSSDFRIPRSKRAKEPVNFRNCMAHARHVLRSQGSDRDPTDLRHLLLAYSYSVLGANKSLQHVFHDAHLASKATDPENQSLAQAIQGRIKTAIRSQDADQVRREMEAALLGAELSGLMNDECPLMHITLEGILTHGVDLVQSQGDAGLAEFVGKMDGWCAKGRKKGGQGWLRKFLNLLAYECKVSFYRCYANTWIDLIPWLKEHRSLDEVSAKFLGFWHMQNQPTISPEGRCVRDVFCGQVLSLHPLSGFFMKDRAACSIAGAFFGTDASDRVMHSGQPDNHQYWNLVDAILTSAHLYRQALEQQTQHRGVRRCNDDVGECSVPAESSRSFEVMIEEFLQVSRIVCSNCGAALFCQRIHPAAPEAPSFTIDSQCSGCDKKSETVLNSVKFKESLFNA